MPMIQDDGFEALLEPFYNGKKLSDPVSTKEDKYQLLPAFLKVKGESQTQIHKGSSTWFAPTLIIRDNTLTVPPSLRSHQTAH